jgi:membrane protease YdiL (CAAX protease family)
MTPDGATPEPPGDRIASSLRGFGPVAILFIVVVLLVGPLIGASLVLVWAWGTKTPWRDLGFVRPRSWVLTIVGGIIAGVALKLLMKAVVMPLLGAPPVNPAYSYLKGNTEALPGFLANVIITAGIGEEILWRGFLFERMGKLWGTTRRAKFATVFITATLFGLAHYVNQHWMGVEQAFIVGLVFGTYFVITRRLWPLMVAHAAFDVIAVLIVYYGWEERVAHAVFR